jgi:subtilisin-like proprotein convertase family protein
LAANGTLSGTPTTTGTFNFTVRATDANQCASERTYALTVTAAAGCPTVAGVNPATGAVGAAVTITGTNFTGVTGVKFANNVTATFTVVNDTTITTTVPAGAVTGPITISKTGCADVQTAVFTIGCPAITINPAALPDGNVNVAYNQPLTAAGGTAPYAFSLIAGKPVTTGFNGAGPVAIPDNNPTGADLPVTVSGVTSPITKVTVSMHITHTFDGDLTLQLIGPDGTTVNLSNKRGGNGGNFGSACAPEGQRTTFDDAAATVISAGAAPFIGSFRPEQVLSAFNGKTGAAVNGVWRLRVVDGAAQDIGSIQCVSIFITQTLPAPGLSLATNGTLSGTPTTEGTFNFTVRATDANQCVSERTYALTIGAAAAACPTVTGVNPTTGVVGAAVTITGTNFTGVTGVKFANNLTAAFTVVNTTTITTTVPAGAVTGPITISKTGCADVQTASFTIGGGCPTITINPATLPNGNVGGAYNQALSATGGTAPYTFSLTAGNPVTTGFNGAGPVAIPDNNPAGADLNVAVSGITSPITKVTVSLHITHTFVRDLKLQLIGPDGTTVDLAVNRGPNAATTGYGTACAPDSSKTAFDDAAATLIANGAPPFVGTFKPDQVLSAFNGRSGAAVNGTWKLRVIDNANVDIGSIQCASIFISQTLPAPGLTLATNGTLSGTPTTEGTFNFTVRATDANQCSSERTYALTIGAAAAACPTVTNISSTTGAAGATVTITGTNFTGVTGVKFANSLTAAFTVVNATTITTTVPAGAVTGPITISKTGCADAQTAAFTIGCPTITINPAALPNGNVGGAYNQALSATGGTGPYTFSLTAGNPGTTRFNAPGPVAIPDNNPAGAELPVTVSGITAPITKVTVSLHITHTFDQDLRLQLVGPDGTTVNLSNNRGAGGDNYGSACAPEGQRTTFDDAAATAIGAGAAPFIGSFRPEQVLSAFNGKTGAAVNGVWRLRVVDGAADDIGSIQCVSIFITQTLPAPGLSLAADGTLSGTPTTAGTFNFTVRATDANQCAVTRAYTLTIGTGNLGLRIADRK